MCAGTSAKSRMIAAQNSTLVSRTRSGRRARSSASAAFSSASATSYRGALELARGAAQDARPRVLGAVHAVPEAHQPLAAVEQVLHVRLGVAGALDVLDHPEHARRRAAVQRAGEGADRAGQRCGHVGPGRGDDAGGEGGGVHAVLGGRDQVGVDGLHVLGVRLAPPADHEPLDDGVRLVDLAPAAPSGGRCPRADCATNDIAITEARASSSRAVLVVDVEQRLEPPGGGEHRQRGLDVDPHVAGVHRQRERLGRRQSRVELVVDQQAPHVAVRDAADEVLDVDAAVAQRAALFVGLGDLGLERDDALETRLEVRSWPPRRPVPVTCVVSQSRAGRGLIVSAALGVVYRPVAPCRPGVPRTAGAAKRSGADP